MFLDKSLRIALLISTIFHTVMFLPWPYFRTVRLKQDLAVLKITYLLLEQKPVAKVIPQENKKISTAKFEEVVKPVPAQEQPLKKLVKAPEPEPEKEKIEIPPELPKEKEAVYLSYYRSIREKIRRYVVNNYPHYIAQGEVCLYFVLLSNGRLKQVNILEERSAENHQLREIAQRSLRQASPFLAFPKDLDQPQLSFNVIISFELEN